MTKYEWTILEQELFNVAIRQAERHNAKKNAEGKKCEKR